ncbi:hypothetical protein DFS34DRAFT_634802 [Phlyctochytrium arcticum]|nr:hypothetical protein DFS34DRAFT_634802 [Phlyctochytrium arcticum]
MHISSLVTGLVALVCAAGTVVVAQPAAPSVPNCKPGDLPCLMTQAQYTILGTVTNNNANSGQPGASAQNYNATVKVFCVYASFGNNKGTGAAFNGQEITVTGFGNPNARCPNNAGADAAVNTQNIFFVYVASMVAQGTIPVFTIFNPCGGGIPYNQDNLQTLSNALAPFPQNSLPQSGSCALPPATVTTPAPGAQPTNAGNNGNGAAGLPPTGNDARGTWSWSPLTVLASVAAAAFGAVTA